MKKGYKALSTILTFLILSLIVTWPLVIKLNSIVLCQPGDAFGTIYNIYNDISRSANYLFPNHGLYILLSKYLAILSNEIISYNILFIFSVFISGLSFYFVNLHLTKNKVISFILGITAIIIPYRFYQSLQHVNLQNIGFLGFFIYFLLKSKNETNYKNTFFAGLFFVLTTLDSYIYGLFAGVILIIFLSVITIKKRIKREKLVNKKSIWPIFASSFITLIVLGYFTNPFWMDIVKTNNGEKTGSTSVRNIEELTTYSGYIGYYFLPSPDNPFFGKMTKKYYDDKIDKLGTNRTEQVNYLGYTLILLAIIWFFYFIKNHNKISDNKKFATYFFGLVGFVGFYLSFSYPIRVLDIQINPIPEVFFRYAPFFRVFSRFSLLASIGLTALSSLGLNYLTNKIKTRWKRYLLMFIVLGLIIIEFISLPEDGITHVSEELMPEVYNHLPKEDCKILEFPFFSKDSPQSYEYFLWNRINRCDSVNYEYRNTIDSPEAFRGEIRDLDKQSDIDKLKNLGVIYIVIHKDKFLKNTNKQLVTDTLNNKVPDLEDLDKLTKIGEWENKELYRLD